MKLRALLYTAAATCFTLAAFAQAPPATTANPAMWKIQGTHGPIYLFGTVHVMKKDVLWQTPKVQAAFKSSNTLYLEVADTSPEAVKAAQPMIIQMGLDPEHPLSTKISKEDVTALDAVAKELGAPGEASFEPMRPWLLYLTLAVLPSVKAGYDPNSGIDHVLAADAKTQGKTIKGFESLDQQVHFLADFPEPQQVTLLHEEIVDLPKSVKQMDDVVADWTRGDVEKIAARDNDELKVKHPELYDRLLVKRNAQFADAIAAMAKDPAAGPIFVAVGAGHLAGPDSVVKMLQQKGITVTREE